MSVRYKRSARNAVQHFWVSWKSEDGRPYFAYGDILTLKNASVKCVYCVTECAICSVCITGTQCLPRGTSEIYVIQVHCQLERVSRCVEPWYSVWLGSSGLPPLVECRRLWFRAQNVGQSLMPVWVSTISLRVQRVGEADRKCWLDFLFVIVCV